MSQFIEKLGQWARQSNPYAHLFANNAGYYYLNIWQRAVIELSRSSSLLCLMQRIAKCSSLGFNGAGTWLGVRLVWHCSQSITQDWIAKLQRIDQLMLHQNSND